MGVPRTNEDSIVDSMDGSELLNWLSARALEVGRWRIARKFVFAVLQIRGTRCVLWTR